MRAFRESPEALHKAKVALEKRPSFDHPGPLPSQCSGKSERETHSKVKRQITIHFQFELHDASGQGIEARCENPASPATPSGGKSSCSELPTLSLLT